MFAQPPESCFSICFAHSFSVLCSLNVKYPRISVLSLPASPDNCPTLFLTLCPNRRDLISDLHIITFFQLQAFIHALSFAWPTILFPMLLKISYLSFKSQLKRHSFEWPFLLLSIGSAFPQDPTRDLSK